MRVVHCPACIRLQTKDELLAPMRADRADFDTVLLAVPPEVVDQPLLDGSWSVKDLVAHIAAL